MMRNKFLAQYLTGLAICLLSYEIFDHFEGTRANALALLIYIGGHGFQWNFGVRSSLIGVALASLILALVFVLVFWLISKQGFKFRVPGYILLALLALATFCWGQLSPTMFDPAPIEQSR